MSLEYCLIPLQPTANDIWFGSFVLFYKHCRNVFLDSDEISDLEELGNYTSEDSAESTVGIKLTLQ